MGSYRFKNLSGNHKKRLLLPLSGGFSSLVILHVLDAQLSRQLEKQNRTAYDLVLIHIVLPDSTDSVSAAWCERISSRFSSHEFLPPVTVHDALQIDDRLEQDLLHIGIRRTAGDSDSEFYSSVLSSTRSVTTRTDLTELFSRRLLVSMAKQYTCESIVWGHSDSKLAAQALADVAKGRGGTIPADISDGLSTTGVNFNYPMRDLFKSELELYATVLLEPLEVMSDIDAGPTPSIRNTSIDTLLSNYILSQGEKYPSIMANVVRTVSKLQVPEHVSEAALCRLCKHQIQPQGPEKDQNKTLCYGCERMKQDIMDGI